MSKVLPPDELALRKLIERLGPAARGRPGRTNGAYFAIRVRPNSRPRLVLRDGYTRKTVGFNYRAAMAALRQARKEK